MKIKSVLLLLSILSCALMNAQAADTLKFRDGSSEPVKVEEVTATMVKYKKADYPTGPTYSVPLSQITMIVYRNGSRDFFNLPVVPPAQNSTTTTPVQSSRRKREAAVPQAETGLRFSGPRIGVTFIGPGTASDWLYQRGKRPVLTQFGWQLETRIFTASNGVSGLVEFIPLIAGFEQNLFLPSGTLMVGLRTRDGFEFGVGPTVTLQGLGLAVAVGTSFHIDDIYFPINLAFVPSVPDSKNYVNYSSQRTTVIEQTGHRITLTVGFNTRKR